LCIKLIIYPESYQAARSAKHKNKHTTISENRVRESNYATRSDPNYVISRLLNDFKNIMRRITHNKELDDGLI